MNGDEPALRFPILSSQLMPGGSTIERWHPWGTADGRYVGWCGFVSGDEHGRVFDYLGPDPDDPDRIAHYRGPFGFPQADEEVR